MGRRQRRPQLGLRGARRGPLNYAKPGRGDRLVDQIAAAAPKIAATLRGIHERSPQARVLVVGYPAVAPTDGTGCYPLVPLSVDDLAYFDGLLRRTNAMIAEQAYRLSAALSDGSGTQVVQFRIRR